jgi:hypothetical protein
MVKVQLLLRPECRNSSGVNAAASAAAALGLRITSTGAASLAAEVESDRFKELFGATPAPVPARGAGQFDFGSPAGFSLDGQARVPAPLNPYVSSVEVVPPHTGMH